MMGIGSSRRWGWGWGSLLGCLITKGWGRMVGSRYRSFLPANPLGEPKVPILLVCCCGWYGTSTSIGGVMLLYPISKIVGHASTWVRTIRVRRRPFVSGGYL